MKRHYTLFERIRNWYEDRVFDAVNFWNRLWRRR